MQGDFEDVGICPTVSENSPAQEVSVRTWDVGVPARRAVGSLWVGPPYRHTSLAHQKEEFRALQTRLPDTSWHPFLRSLCQSESVTDQSNGLIVDYSDGFPSSVLLSTLLFDQ